MSVAFVNQCSPVEPVRPLTPDHRGIVRSLRFLRRHWREPIGVRDLAQAAGMSLRGFQKAFTRHVGHSPGRELRRIRIQGAMTLFVGTNYAAQAVAAKIGFERVNSFRVAFKQATGVSPLQYRRRTGRQVCQSPFVYD